MIVLEVIGVFFAYIILDFVWAKYTVALAKEQALASANWSMLIAVVAGIAIVTYVHNPWLLIPAALGGWVGTYFGIKWKITK